MTTLKEVLEECNKKLEEINRLVAEINAELKKITDNFNQAN